MLSDAYAGGSGRWRAGRGSCGPVRPLLTDMVTAGGGLEGSMAHGTAT